MAITTKDLTGGEVAGSGLYDELMRTTKAHLDVELAAGNITDQNYSTVYLGALQANLQAASQFVLQREINNQQALLLQEQVRKAEKENDLLTKQIAKVQLDIDTAQYQLDNMLPEQLATQTEQTKLVTAQIGQANAQTTLLGSQNTNMNAESAIKQANETKQGTLIDKQILTETANTATPTAGMTLKAYEKTQAEVNLLNQKKLTEDAQTTDPTGGLLKKEADLKFAQSESFKRDAEQKAAKFYADTFAILYSTSPDVESAENWNLGSDNARLVLEQLALGIGVTAL